MQSIIVYQALQLDDEVGGVLSWEKDIPFPKFLGNEVLGWKTLSQSLDRELAMKMRSQTSIVFWVVSKTKHSKTKTEARSTQISKTKHPRSKTKHPKLENEDP